MHFGEQQIILEFLSLVSRLCITMHLSLKRYGSSPVTRLETKQNSAWQRRLVGCPSISVSARLAHPIHRFDKINQKINPRAQMFGMRASARRPLITCTAGISCFPFLRCKRHHVSFSYEKYIFTIINPSYAASDPLRAVEGDIVTVHWKCLNEQGEVLESSKASDEPTTFEVGAGDIVGNQLFEAFDEAVRGLAVNETIGIKVCCCVLFVFCLCSVQVFFFVSYKNSDFCQYYAFTFVSFHAGRRW